jgi:hypothetical protein
MAKGKTVFREPLVHFLLIGAALFVAFNFTQAPGDNAPERIVVSSDWVAQLTAQFERTWLRLPTEAELSGLVDSFVRDEIYYLSWVHSPHLITIHIQAGIPEPQRPNFFTDVVHKILIEKSVALFRRYLNAGKVAMASHPDLFESRMDEKIFGSFYAP